VSPYQNILIAGKYSVVELLGSGGFSQVFKGMALLLKIYVIMAFLVFDICKGEFYAAKIEDLKTK